MNIKRLADDPRVWPFNKKFYLILNLAYGGSWGGYDGVDDSKLPHQFLIDYVRVYQLQEGDGPFSLNITPATQAVQWKSRPNLIHILKELKLH